MLRKEEVRNRRSQARTVVISTQRVPMTRGASLRSRVKGNFQARFWSSGGRGDSPTDCRKLSESLWGSHGYLLASVWSTLTQIARRLFAHDNPNSLTACLLRYCSTGHLCRVNQRAGWLVF